MTDNKKITGDTPEFPVNRVDHIEAGAPGQTQVPTPEPIYSQPEEQIPVATPADFAPANTAPPAVVNPLLARVQLPGETFKLPSCGLFYGNGELDPSVKDAEVHVHPMTVLDEIMIKTPDLLFSGKAVEEVFGRCIPQVLKPSKLLAKDVDFLLLCLRKVSYGEVLEMESSHYKCKAVEKTTMHSYPINVSHFIKNSKRIDPTGKDNQFRITLPNQQVVDMQPVRFEDFVTLMQAQELESTASPEEQVAVLVEALSNIIVRVDEITDSGMIIEWLRSIKPEFLNKLNQKLEETVHWGPDFTYKVECQDCGEVQEVTAPLNPLAFFT